MKILITGGSGVIGLNLASEYIQDLSQSEVEIFLIHQRPIPTFLLETIDPNARIQHLASLDELTKDIIFDLIVNCGGMSQPNLFTRLPELLVSSNINELVRLSDFLASNGTFVHMSTSEIYSGCPMRPCDENHRGTVESQNPRRIYMMTKEISELAIANEISSEQRLLNLRISLVFGKYFIPGDQRVLYSFVEQALRGEINSKGGLSNVRRYLYCSDLYRIIQDLIVKASPGVHTFNVGGQEKTSIKDLGLTIAEITGVVFNGSAEKSEGEIGAPDEVWVDTTRLFSLIGFRPLISLSDGLRQTIDWRKSVKV